MNINITVNGKEVEIQDGLALRAWLEGQNNFKAWTVVEYNGEILERELWPSTVLHEGDKLEVLVLLGGG